MPPLTCITVAWLHDNFGDDWTVQMWTWNALKTLQFNWQWKCWEGVTGHHIPPRNLYCNPFMKMVSVKPVFITFCREDRYGTKECGVSTPSPDLTPLDFYLWVDLKHCVHQKTKSTEGPEGQNWNCLLLLHQQKCKNYATLLHVIINNAMGADSGHFQHLCI
jgi:hypothetical protein